MAAAQIFNSAVVGSSPKSSSPRSSLYSHSWDTVRPLTPAAFSSSALVSGRTRKWTTVDLSVNSPPGGRPRFRRICAKILLRSILYHNLIERNEPIKTVSI
jgi:hypothetical protein